MTKQDYTTTEAAQYCGLTRAGFVYHLQAQHVAPDYRIGNAMVFTLPTLDAFNAARRPAGRPRQDMQREK